MSKKELRIQNDYLRAELKTFRQERDAAKSRVRELEKELASGRGTESLGDVSEPTEVAERNAELEEQIAVLQRELNEARDGAELWQLRAVDEARKEARAREKLLESVIEDLRQRLKDARERSPSPTSAGSSEGVEPTGEDVPEDAIRPEEDGHDRSSSRDIETRLDIPPSTSWMAQNLPTLGKFSGEETLDSDETFDSWIEQLELMADACGWEDKVKLVHLTTRLKGAALSFYRSCSLEQRRSYSKLKQELQINVVSLLFDIARVLTIYSLDFQVVYLDSWLHGGQSGIAGQQ